MVWHPDDNRILSGSRDATVREWDVRTGKCIHTLTGHTDWVKCLAVDEDILISGSCDGRTKVWSLARGQCMATLLGGPHSGSVNSVQVWKPTAATTPTTPPPPPEGVATTTTTKFITGSADSSLRVWDASNNWECSQTLLGHTDEIVASSQFLSNCVASASFDGNIRIWEPDQGKSHRTIAAHTHRITSMKVHGSCILTASWDKTAKVCEFGLDFRV